MDEKDTGQMGLEDIERWMGQEVIKAKFWENKAKALQIENNLLRQQNDGLKKRIMGENKKESEPKQSEKESEAK